MPGWVNRLAAGATRATLPAVAIAGTIVAFAPTGAEATTYVTLTCAEIGQNYAVSSDPSSELRAVLTPGDTITVTVPTGYYYPPSSSSTPITGSVTLTITTAGTYTFARSSTGNEMTASCGVPGNTADLQNDMTTMVMTQQATRMAAAVGHNVDGVFNGGTAPSVSNNGFFFQSAGLSKAVDPKIHVSTSGAGGADWNVWGQGRYTRYEGNAGSFSGDQIDLTLGADYRIDADTLIGGLVGYGKTDFSIGTTDGFDAKGRTLGAYWAHRFGNLTANAILARTWSDYDVTQGTVTGNFDAARWTVAASVKGSMKRPGVTIEPIAQLVYAIEDQDAYTDSFGSPVAARTVRAGQVSVGPKLVFDARSTANGAFRPWLAAYADYTFSNTSATPTSSLPDLGKTFSGRVAGGFSFAFTNGGQIDFDLGIGGLGSGDYTSYTAGLKYQLRF